MTAYIQYSQVNYSNMSIYYDHDKKNRSRVQNVLYILSFAFFSFYNFIPSTMQSNIIQGGSVYFFCDKRTFAYYTTKLLVKKQTIHIGFYFIDFFTRNIRVG